MIRRDHTWRTYALLLASTLAIAALLGRDALWAWLRARGWV